MSESPVNLSSGIPETVLPEVSATLQASLTEALKDADPRAAIGSVIVADPTYLDAWARLNDVARDAIERYAYARVGYHRGLDTLRKSGWRGTGYVRWSAESNRGFLRCLERLRLAAEEIGEATEAERCALFLKQLDPDWDKTEHD